MCQYRKRPRSPSFVMGEVVVDRSMSPNDPYYGSSCPEVDEDQVHFEENSSGPRKQRCILQSNRVSQKNTIPQRQSIEYVQSSHRDEMVAALLTVASALGLTMETLHISVDLIDRYLKDVVLELSQLEKLCIACLWIAVKFMETPISIEQKSIKTILKSRQKTGNWTWREIMQFESKILKQLSFRILSSTVRNLFQAKLQEANKKELPLEKIALGYYFADLFLLKNLTNQYPRQLVVDAIWYLMEQEQPCVPEIKSPLLGPVVILFLAHRDIIDPNHQAYKNLSALRCKYGRFLQSPWQVPFNPECRCRACKNVPYNEW